MHNAPGAQPHFPFRPHGRKVFPMKSRLFLQFHSTRSTRTAPLDGSPRVGAPWAIAQGAGVSSRGLSAARRFELARVPSVRRDQRRGGQALLLAVLIMLLAALLSAGFLAVLSGNLNQTARISDKSRAIEASRAGVQFANEQLSNTINGDQWRPVDANPAPSPGAISYNAYYSQLDQVQGWANQLAQPTNPNAPNYQQDLKNYRNSVYAKFPDPTQPIGNAPKFLVKVEDLPANPNDIFYSTHPYDAEHVGEIRITSIGLSDDDPNVFHKTVAYKIGRDKTPWANALRSVSNWNFGGGGLSGARSGVPFAKVTAATGPGDSVDVPVDTKDAPLFSNADAPFNVVIVRKDPNNPTAGLTRGAVVTKVTAPAPGTTTATLTLAGLTVPLAADDIIQKAAAIGTAPTIDLLNTGTTTPPVLPVQDQPSGVLANGSLWLQGQIQLTTLQKYYGKIQSSGAVAISDAQKTVTPSGDVTQSGSLVPSFISSFPGSFDTNAASTGIAKTDLVNDAWNKLNVAQPLGLDYSSGNTRAVDPFKPVAIDSKNNLARYRTLTRNADADSNGYKAGVYIDNADDVEKVGTGNNAAMTQSQLMEMLVSAPTAGTPAVYTRNGTASLPAATGVSLEERHLRGWVGPEEFLPRGALVEITNDSYPNLGITGPSLRVTLDARSDDNFNGPAPSKTWRTANGAADPGVYTRVFPWPADGVIFAEGNLRIRGDVGTNAAPRSLTVVSLNNIYIEGSLSIDNSLAANGAPNPERKKVLLLAKKNVIVNPTRALVARTDVATTAKNTQTVNFTGTPAAPATTNLNVANVYAFNIGDYATVAGQPDINSPGVVKTIRGLVTSRIYNSATDQQLSIKTTDTGIVTANSNAVVRSPLETREIATGATTPDFYSLVDTENAFNRRIVSPLASPNSLGRFVFDHVGDLKQTASVPNPLPGGALTPGQTVGLNIKADDFTPAVIPRPGGFTAELTNKQQLLTGTQNIDPAAVNVLVANKILRTYNNFTPGNQKDFTNIIPTPVPPAPDKTLTQFAAEISGVQESTAVPPPTGYRYVATLTDPGLGVLPYYSLAGVGLRYAPGTDYVPNSNQRQSFNVTPNTPDGYTIPMATSVEFDLNSALSNITPLSSSLAVKYFGFVPTYAANEDALTVDSTFYQLQKDIAKSTLDSRFVDLPPFPTTGTAPTYGYSTVLKRSNAFSDASLSTLLPDYRVRALKMENINLSTLSIQPAALAPLTINAFVYAQEGSWLVIPGDYFRSNPAVRATVDVNGNLKGSYIDYNGDNQPTPNSGEYLTDSSGREYADLNRNGALNNGERLAALRFTRYNYFQIKFVGAILENQTAVVSDVKDTAGTTTLATGAVAQWMDKWATYTDGSVTGATSGNPANFKFMSYTYDPSLANGGAGADDLKVPVSTDLLYEQ